MDLGLAWAGVRDEAAPGAALARLDALGWAGGALDVELRPEGAMAPPGGPREADEGEDEDAVDALMEHAILRARRAEATLPPASELAAALGVPSLPLESVSERLRGAQAQQDGQLSAGRQMYCRVTISFASSTTLFRALRDPALGMFDIVAVRPLTPAAMSAVLKSCEPNQEGAVSFDLISLCLDADELLVIPPSDMANLRRAKVFLEVPYGPLVAPASRSERSQAIVQAERILSHVHRGHLHAKGKFCNVIFGSGECPDRHKVKPERVIELAQGLGLREMEAKAAVTTSCQALLERAELRRRRAGMI